MSTVSALLLIFSCLAIGFLIGFKSKEGFNNIKIKPSDPELFVDAEFDIEGIDVISVDKDDNDCTMITFTLKSDPSNIYKWSFDITDEKHNEFVDRFKKKVQDKSNTQNTNG